MLNLPILGPKIWNPPLFFQRRLTVLWSPFLLAVLESVGVKIWRLFKLAWRTIAFLILSATLHKTWPVFPRVRTKSTKRFCSYTGEYGSVKTRILTYFMQTIPEILSFSLTLSVFLLLIISFITLSIYSWSFWLQCFFFKLLVSLSGPQMTQ